MKQQLKLSVRCPSGNENHHLWNNHGIWWCHLTLHLPNYQKERIRLSLGTHEVGSARELRDCLFRLLSVPQPA